MANNHFYPIHPSIIATAGNKTPAANIPICFELIKGADDILPFCSPAVQGSLSDLKDIIAELIYAANANSGGQYEYRLADDSSNHVYSSFEQFENDSRRNISNQVAVFCCPLSYFSEYSKRRPRGLNQLKFIYQAEDQQLEPYQELKQFYTEIRSTEKMLTENIFIFDTLLFIARHWFKLVHNTTMHGVQVVTDSVLSKKGTYS